MENQEFNKIREFTDRTRQGSGIIVALNGRRYSLSVESVNGKGREKTVDIVVEGHPQFERVTLVPGEEPFDVTDFLGVSVGYSKARRRRSVVNIRYLVNELAEYELVRR